MSFPTDMSHKTLTTVRLIQEDFIRQQLKKEEHMEQDGQQERGILSTAIATLRIAYQNATDNEQIQRREGRIEEADNNLKNAHSYWVALQLCESNDALLSFMDA